jgi:hypothetical protein
MLVGVAAGFAPMDLYAVSEGFEWSCPDYMSLTVLAMCVGGVMGLATGWMVDACVFDAESRRKVVRRMWALLLIGTVLFLISRTVFQMAGEPALKY